MGICQELAVYVLLKGEVESCVSPCLFVFKNHVLHYHITES